MEVETASSVPQPDSTSKRTRNRRFKRLLQLREEGFFSEDAIKLRHPMLYHNYLGDNTHRSQIVQHPTSTLSHFLEKNLINLEYKRKLAEQMNQNMISEEKQEIDNEDVEWKGPSEEQIELEEENLIDHAEQLFLEGKVDIQYVDYTLIDNNSDLDEQDQQNRDEQQRYFDNDEEEDENINKKYYTGILDY